MKPYVRVLKVIGNVLLWLFVAFAVAMTTMALAAQANADGVPAIGGKCYMTVLENSMKPTFKKGDLLICDMLSIDEKKELQVGDVISFYDDLNGDGQLEINTHRIIKVNGDGNGKAVTYETQGDNVETNYAPDPRPVHTSNVICKWNGKSKIGGVGGFIAFLQKPAGFMVLIVLPLGLLFFYEAYSFIRTVNKVKNSGKRQITAADEELIKQRAIEEYLRSQAAQQAQNSTQNDTPAEDNKQ